MYTETLTAVLFCNKKVENAKQSGKRCDSDYFLINYYTAIKNICDSWQKVKISVLPGVCKKQIQTLMDDCEIQDFIGGSNCRCGGNIKRTRIRNGI